MSLKDTILAAQDMKREAVEVPEWACTVYVRCMSASERDSFESAVYDAKSKGVTGENIRAKLLVRCLCDDNGARLFTDTDVASLGSKSAAVVDRLFDIAQRLNGIGAKDVEDLEKN